MSGYNYDPRAQAPYTRQTGSSSVRYNDQHDDERAQRLTRRTPPGTSDRISDERNPFDSSFYPEDLKPKMPRTDKKPSLLHRAGSFFRTADGEHRKASKMKEIHHDYAAQQVKVNRIFMMKLAKALLSFGAPAHRVDEQLKGANDALQAGMTFTLLPNTVIVTLEGRGGRHQQTRYIKATSKTALTKLQRVNTICYDVTQRTESPDIATAELDKIMKEPPMYSALLRCCLSFITGAIMCTLSFGGSPLDMAIAGVFGFVLRFLSVSSVTSSAIYGNVYEISLTFLISFIAKGLSTIHGRIFCYSAISSASIVSILPGYTILIASLELTAESQLNGTAKLVYAIVYTLFLGFSLTIGKDVFSTIRTVSATQVANTTLTTGSFIFGNGTNAAGQSLLGESIPGAFNITLPQAALHTVKGCYRSTAWPWWLQPLPEWTYAILVPLYAICSTINNLQRWKGKRFIESRFSLMTVFSCLSWTANKAAGMWVHSSPGTVSAAGALVISILGSVYGQFEHASAFTTMVPGVLFLVPSSIGQSGTLVQSDADATTLYMAGFSLALRTIQVAIGVSIGLFVGQSVVFAVGVSAAWVISRFRKRPSWGTPSYVF